MRETFAFYGITWHHTRLQRRCCECDLRIERGERYQRLSGVFEGQWFNYSTCEACAKVRDEFFPATFTITGLMEELMDKRDALSYDDVRNWAMLTNAIAGLRQRMGAATRPTHPPITPTYCFAQRKPDSGT